MHHIMCHLTLDGPAAASPPPPCQVGEAEKKQQLAPQLIRDTEKALRALWGEQGRGGGKLAHIRLITGPQSPLTFASQSQV